MLVLGCIKRTSDNILFEKHMNKYWYSLNSPRKLALGYILEAVSKDTLVFFEKKDRVYIALDKKVYRVILISPQKLKLWNSLEVLA